MNEFIKKNSKYIIGVILVISIGWGIYSGINSRIINGKLREAERNLTDLGEKISVADSTIRSLKDDNNRFKEIIDRSDERFAILDEIQRGIASGNRRTEEIYRSIAGGITKIQSGLSGIEKNFGKLDNTINQLGDSMDGNLDLIREGLEILNGVSK